jgi:molybdopterin synthase catalytic subunit
MSALNGPPPNDAPNPPSSTLLDPAKFPQCITTDNIHVELRFEALDVSAILQCVRSPTCGANVLFLGTTRNSVDNRPVAKLSYSAYPALALKSFESIAKSVIQEHGLEKVCIVHRLGPVPVEEESIAVAVSAGHRGPAWRGAEGALEKCKERVEVWKMEIFGDGEGAGEWRANKERDNEGKTVKPQTGS